MKLFDACLRLRGYVTLSSSRSAPPTFEARTMPDAPGASVAMRSEIVYLIIRLAFSVVPVVRVCARVVGDL